MSAWSLTPDAVVHLADKLLGRLAAPTAHASGWKPNVAASWRGPGVQIGRSSASRPLVTAFTLSTLSTHGAQPGACLARNRGRRG
jgi:hypothetical protein